MSEVIKGVFTNYIFCAVIGGVLHYLAPENSKKTLRAVVISIIIVATFSPLVKGGFDINFEAPVQINEDYDALVHTANLMEKKLRSEIKEILINFKVREYEIYITTTVDEEKYTVYLESIVIELGEEYKHLSEEIKSSISEEYHHILQVGVKNG